MAEVHFKPNVEISIPTSALNFAKRLQCTGTDFACQCECHFAKSLEYMNSIKCNCSSKGYIDD